MNLEIDQGNSWSYPGARWWKFDFHTHTPMSVDYGKGPTQSALKSIDPEEWLLGFMRATIDCVAVTDHNTGEWIDRLKEELSKLEAAQHPEFRPLHLFPGVELSVNGGFHLLAIFDTASATSDIDSLMGAVDYDGSKGDSDGATRKSPAEVVDIVLDRGGIPIPAHANSYKGLLRPKTEVSRRTALDSNTIRQVLDIPDILAMEVTERDFTKPGIFQERNLAWAEVLGSDTHHLCGDTEQSFPGSRFTWVKMAKPTLEGLRLALLDGGGFSVRRSDELDAFDPFLLPNDYVESIDIKDARYMGHGPHSSKLDFSPWLNALVGGRGTGKSTVIHALRLVTQRESDFEALPTHTDSQETFRRFNQVPADQTKDGGLTDSTRIQLTLMRDGVRHRINWGNQNVSATVEDESTLGEWKPSGVQTVTPNRFPLQLFSQGQIAELAGGDPTALLGEIDRAAGIEPLRARLLERVSAFDTCRARIRQLDNKLKGQEGPTTLALQDVERKLARFEAAEHAKVLTAYRHRSRQRQVVDDRIETVEAVAERIDEMASGFQLDVLPDGLFDLASEEDRPVVDLVNALREALEKAVQDSQDVAQRLRDVVGSQRDSLKNSKWEARLVETNEAYEGLVKDLKTEGVTDPNEYSTLVGEKQGLDEALKTLESERRELSDLVNDSHKLLQRVCGARQAMTIARRNFLSSALSQNDLVRIEIQPYGNDQKLIESSLRQRLNVLDERFSDDILAPDGESPSRGLVYDLTEGLPQDVDARMSDVENRLNDLKERFESACRGKSSFGGHFNNYLEREFERTPDLLDNLLTWFPEDGLSVTYSRLGDGSDFQPISQASAGQRSAAMLAFLLAHGEEPLVLDQPEDDLDNHLIYDLVVRQIRENKLRRQIIVVTHNPNIVVNGDAEMLHALSFEGGQCTVKQSGSLQEKAIREEVCRVMEGGREAFRRRYRRLGWEPMQRS